MKRLVSFMIAILLLISPLYAADKSIVEIATSTDDFSILVQALQTADLVTALSGEGPFTVFAPTNAAFQKLLNDLNITADQLLAHPQLSEVLLYHVVSGKVMSTDLSNGMVAETLQKESITIDLNDGVKINQSSVTNADVEATNGVIHIIDTVLVPASFKLNPDPQTVVDIALGNEDFSMLVSLLQKANLVSALQGEGPFTVFAPTNAAFEKLLSDLNITATDLMNQPELAEVLLYHVVSGKVESTGLSNGMSAETLNGESIAIDLTSGVKINSSNVIAADIMAQNGVVHVIDTVLVPQGFTYVPQVEDTQLPKTGTLDLTLVSLLGIISLTGALWALRRFQIAQK